MIMLNKMSFEGAVCIVASALPVWLSSCLGNTVFPLFFSPLLLVVLSNLYNLSMCSILSKTESSSFFPPFFTFFPPSFSSLCNTPECRPLTQWECPSLLSLSYPFFPSALYSEVTPLWCRCTFLFPYKLAGCPGSSFQQSQSECLFAKTLSVGVKNIL